MRFLKSYLLVFLFFIPIKVNAQSSDVDFNVLFGSPQNDFRNNLDRNAFGLNGSYAYQIPNTSIHLGAEMGFMTYGQDTRKEAFSLTIPDVSVEVKTDYNIATGHLFLRYEFNSGLIKPYLDGLIGLQYLFTNTTISDFDTGNDPIASETNFDDTAFSYGYGGGLKFSVAEQNGSPIFINLKIRYLQGNEAAYLQPGSIIRDSGQLRFDEATSSTDLLTIHLGVAFKF